MHTESESQVETSGKVDARVHAAPRAAMSAALDVGIAAPSPPGVSLCEYELTAPLRPGLPLGLQRVVALAGLIAAAPVLLLVAAGVALDSPGPVFFRQHRVGRAGVPFTLYKFRTMRVASGGFRVTVRGDQRVTRFGNLLRRTKLDEVPGLLNVVGGSMALVGPRPEVPEFVDLTDPLWRAVLRVPPGIASEMAIALRREERLMGLVPAAEREVFYTETLEAYKLLGHLRALNRRSPARDLGVLVRTVVATALPFLARPPSPEAIRASLSSPVPPRRCPPGAGALRRAADEFRGNLRTP